MVKALADKSFNGLGSSFEVIEAPASGGIRAEPKSAAATHELDQPSPDRFERIIKRTTVAAVLGLGTAGIIGLPLGYVNGLIANTVLNGVPAFATHDPDAIYTALGLQTSSTCVAHTAAQSLMAFPVFAMLDASIKSSAKPYKQPICLTLAQVYLSSATGAMAGVAVGTLMGYTLQVALGTDSQVGYDAARMLGASAGAAIFVLGYHLTSTKDNALS